MSRGTNDKCTSSAPVVLSLLTRAGWMCGVKLKDRLPSKELRERLGVDDIASVSYTHLTLPTILRV